MARRREPAVTGDAFADLPEDLRWASRPPGGSDDPDVLEWLSLRRLWCRDRGANYLELIYSEMPRPWPPGTSRGRVGPFWGR